MTTTMNEPVNFVCWSADTVTATIPTEAATPSKAVLLATHSPLRITRQRGATSGPTTSDYVTEGQILDEFLTAPPTNGVLVASVLGESGAGKSHLVRWIDANIPETPTRHVIYLQKTETSLKDVIEKLLLDQNDPEFDDIRRKLSSLGTGMTLEEMEQRILLELAEVLRTLEPDTPLAKSLVGDNGLRLFFLDPLFRDHLLRPDSFIKRRARYSLYGRDESEPDVPLEFTTAELPIDIGDYVNITDAAAATQKIFRRLGNPSLQVEAVRLLNKVLDTAVTKAASLNVGDVSQAFKRIRKKFVGHEIVLLVEDVALIQGVRRDLLDAIVEVGVVQGVEKYATVRTMMAVTPAYYRESLPDTFRTRAEASSPTYRIDLELDADGVQEEDFVDFFGRYLNAARVGKSELEKSTPTVPNACDTCQYRASCHDAFGASGQEYGLYPYNKAALIRAVRACADHHDERSVFNPRRVLARAVRDVLTDNVHTIRNGTFPPAALLADESAKVGLSFLPTHVRERIESDFPEQEAGRLKTLLTFWGREGTEQIDAGILRAFSHQPIPTNIVDATAPSPVPGPAKPEPSEPTDAIPRSLRKQLDDIEAWSNGKVLPQELARDLRAIVREALLARVDWFDTVIKEPNTTILDKAVPNNSRGVSIEGANEGLVGDPIIQLSRDARTAMMFRGLLYIRYGLWQHAGQALPRLDEIVSRHVDEAKRRILDVLAIDVDSLASATASLIRGAAACGHLAPNAKDLDYINAALWHDPTRHRTDSAVRSPRWQAAYEAYVASRGEVVEYLLRAVGAAQGTGGVYAIDPHRMTLIIRKAKVLAASEDEIAVPTWCEQAHRKLKELTRSADAQIEHWQALVDRIRKHLPSGVSLNETIDAVSEATHAGQSHGYVKVRDNLDAVHARNETARSWDQTAISTVTRLVDSAKTQSGLLRLNTVGTDAGADLPAIAEYLEYSAEWIEAGIASAEADTGTATDIDEQLANTITMWFETIKESEAHD